MNNEKPSAVFVSHPTRAGEPFRVYLKEVDGGLDWEGDMPTRKEAYALARELADHYGVAVESDE